MQNRCDQILLTLRNSARLLLVGGIVLAASAPAGAIAGSGAPLPTGTNRALAAPTTALEGTVRVLVEKNAPTSARPSSMPEDRQSTWLETGDGEMVAVSGLEPDDARPGDQVRLSVALPATLIDDVTERVGRQAVARARSSAAPVDSALADAVADLASSQLVTGSVPALRADPDSVRVLQRSAAAAPGQLSDPSTHTVTMAIADLGGTGGEVSPTDADVSHRVREMSDYWSEQSGGRLKMQLAAPATRYSSRLSCAGWDLLTEARQRSGWQGGQRAHLVLVLVNEPNNCGYGSGSLSARIGDEGVVRMVNLHDPSLFAHEIGHNLSFHHADTLECDPGRQDHEITDGTPAVGCTRAWYGDTLDVMAGAGWHVGNLNAAARARVGFFGSQEQRAVSAAGTTAATLVPLSAASGSGLKTVRMTDPRTGVDYHLENRQPSGYDAGRMNAASMRPGLRVVRTTPGGGTITLDGTPSSGGRYDPDRAVPSGGEFTSYGGGVRLSPTQRPDGSVAVQMQLLPAGQVPGTTGPRATVTTIEPPRLVSGQPGRVSGTVSAPEGVPEGTVTVDVGSVSVETGLDGAGRFSADVTAPTAGSVPVSVTYWPSDARRWSSSTAMTTTTVLAPPDGPGAVTLRFPSQVRLTTAGGIVEVAVDGAIDSGVVELRVGDREVASAVPSSGRARLSVPRLRAGAHQLTASWSGATQAPASVATRVAVARAASTTSAALRGSARANRPATIGVRVSSAWGSPSGSMRLVDTRGRTRATARVTGGRTTLTTPRLPRGRHTMSIIYQGNSDVAPSRTKITVRVR